MNEELRELIREIITKGILNTNLVLMTYEVDETNNKDKLERLSVVYETSEMKEGFD